MNPIHSRAAVFSSLLVVALLAGCSKAPPPPPPPQPAPPPPVAAAPEKCGDADRDGICDTDDQCPDTQPGIRVGRAGCDCDYTLRTHFAYDSAEYVPAEDKVELDRLANFLKNPKLNFIAGQIDGYTDNVGDVTYNKTLSKQRAETVAKYLKESGVMMGERFVANGFGADNPIADNSTEDGRAENRRVTIRRTDCGPVNPAN